MTERSSGARVLLLLVPLAAVVVLASLAVGSQSLSPGVVVRWAAGADVGPDAGILDARLQRTGVGVAVGMALAAAGSVLQAVTRNPLADPGILGVTSGAALGVVVGITTLGLGTAAGYTWCALAGAAAALAVVHLVSQLTPSGRRPLTVVLTGAAVTALSTSLVSALMLTNEHTLDRMRVWQVGGVGGRDLGTLLTVLPMLGAGLLLLVLTAPAVAALTLGDDVARSLGHRIGPARAAALLGAVLLAAGATAVAGPIGFLGLLVPHLLRRLGVVSYPVQLALCVLAGPTVLLLADTIGRVATPPSEVPVGIMLAAVGAPVLLWLVRRGRRLA